MPLDFTISAPTVDDAARLAVIDETAYDSNPMRNSLSSFRSATPEQKMQHLAWSTESLRKRLQDSDDGIFFKATEQSTGTIAAWMELKKPDFQGPKVRSSGKISQGGGTEPSAELMPTTCWRMDKVEKFLAMWEDARKKTMGDRNDYWCLAKLVVDPEFQRQGVGSILLGKGLDLVDLTSQGIYTGSTPDGEKLAQNYGFKVLSKARCEGIESHLTIMLREGKAKTQ